MRKTGQMGAKDKENNMNENENENMTRNIIC